ncbi:MAG: ribokinase [Clostridia bacterium]|nr:ribokinase [Clostridia bacterium]
MKILNYGSCNVDNVYTLDHIVTEGETEAAEALAVFPGGKGLNQSIALAKAGLSVFHAGCVGADGDFLLELLRENGVNTDWVKQSSEKSGHAVIQVTKHGENCILVYPGANGEIREEDVTETLSHFEAGDWILLQNELAKTEFILKEAEKRGLRILLNPSPCNEALLAADLSSVSVLILNETEAALLSGEKEPLAALERLKKKYPRTQLMLTLGEEGSLFWDGKSLHPQKAYPAEAVDTTAAGDTFTGYFIAGLFEGLPPQEILSRASLAAAIAVSRRGASVSIPRRDEVEAAMARRHSENE